MEASLAGQNDARHWVRRLVTWLTACDRSIVEGGKIGAFLQVKVAVLGKTIVLPDDSNMLFSDRIIKFVSNCSL